MGLAQGYTSSKAGMLGLTRAQAVSLDKKVRVNCVMPGCVTPLGLPQHHEPDFF